MNEHNTWQQTQRQKAAADSRPFVKSNDICTQLWYKSFRTCVSCSTWKIGISPNTADFWYQQTYNYSNQNFGSNYEILAPTVRPGSNTDSPRYYPYHWRALQGLWFLRWVLSPYCICHVQANQCQRVPSSWGGWWRSVLRLWAVCVTLSGLCHLCWKQWGNRK